MPQPTVKVFALCLIAAFEATAAAQPSLAWSGSSPTPPLAGPAVNRESSERRVTLVAREFDGRLKQLESEPVSAAVAIMDLAPGERAAADAVILARKAALDAVLRENIKRVLESQNAFKPGDDGSGQRALSELFEKARPILDKGVLLEQVAAALPRDKARELRRIVNEYMDAAVESRLGLKPGEPSRERFGARLAEGFANFQKEVENSARRVFEDGEREFQDLSRKLGLTPEQEGQVQAMFIDLYADTNGPPSKARQAVVLLKALGLLTPEQKNKLREIVAQEARDAARAKRADRDSRRE